MDRELMQEYRVLHDIQHTPADWVRAADYLALRMEQFGLRISRDNGVVIGVLEGSMTGPALAVGCPYEAQEADGGTVIVHASGNDGLCALILSALKRIFYRGGIDRGRLTVVFRNSTMLEREKNLAEFILTDRGTAEIAVSGTGQLAEHCAEAVQSTMGKCPRLDGEVEIRLGSGAVLNPETRELNYKKIALENGADILETMILRQLCG